MDKKTEYKQGSGLEGGGGNLFSSPSLRSVVLERGAPGAWGLGLMLGHEVPRLPPVKLAYISIINTVTM